MNSNNILVKNNSSYQSESPLFDEVGKNTDKNLLISIVIPIFNEEKTIRNVINRIPDHFHQEIIIVNDGSTDNSVQRIKEIKNKNIILLNHNKNVGYGAAIITGIKHAKGDIIVTMDSDGQHCPEEIPNMIKSLLNDSVDITIGSRYLGKCHFKIPFHIRLAEIVIKSFLSLLFGQVIYNNQNGFRAIKRKCLKIFDKLIYFGMGFTTEILFCSAFHGFKIKEVPITANSRAHGSSYVKKIKTMKSILSLMLYYFFQKKNLNINKMFLKRWFDKIYKKIEHLEIFQ